MFLSPLKKSALMHMPCLLTMILAPICVQTVQAGNMYIYKDNNGQVLLTNVNPEGNFEKFTQTVRVTYYPDPETNAAATNPIASGNTSNNTYPTSYQGFSTPSNSANRNAYDHLIRASAARHGVDAALIKSMMHAESAFNPNARSPVGAQGLMQLMPATASRFSVTNAWDPAQNIEGAAQYIAWLTRRFNGNMEHVVAGYNAGEGNVDKYGGIPPFRETQNYVRKVLGRYNTLYRHDAALGGISVTPTSSSRNGVTIQRAGYTPATTSYGSNRSYSQSAYDALQ